MEPLTTSTDPLDDVAYPFSAIVGQQRLKLALILSAIAPEIGGVLIRGEKGTAKSTAVRALGGAVGAQVVELPIGATEDRVVGSLDLGQVLDRGEVQFAPGVLAQAHGGVLYVDEVNLLADHLVDVLLDSAAMGRVRVERDGISRSYPARFVLVGTMNPEEGELRPQLLDRFGLAVDVAAPTDVDERVEIVTRRLAYEADPQQFAAGYRAAEAELASGVRAARAAIATIATPHPELRRIAALCAEFGVDGLRADIVIARTARAHAAWRGAAAVTADDVRVAAELALPHRKRRDPFDEPGLSESELDDAMDRANDAAHDPADPTDPDDDPGGGGADAADPQREPETSSDTEQSEPTGSGPAPQGTTTAAASRSTARALRLSGLGEGAPGRRSAAKSQRGVTIRATTSPRLSDGAGRGLHLVGSLIAHAERAPGRQRPPRLRRDDLRFAERVGQEGNLIVFLVDLSGSMAAKNRLTAVTGAVTAILRDAYQRRDRVAVVTLRGTTAQIVVPPTRSVDIAVRRLAGLRTGGRTPLAAGLVVARQVIATARRTDPHRRPLLVVLTDGRASDAAAVGGAAAALQRVGSVVVDCEQGFVRLGLAADLARQLDAAYVQLDEVTAQSLTGVIAAA